MFKWWQNLSVSKKLYAVVGLMAVLIASELFTLLFAMNTLSSVRAFVEGEGQWSKSQKNAIHSLYQYALHGDEKYLRDFESNLEIPMGDRKARLELEKPNYNIDIVHEGFLRGGNHPNDIDGMIKLLTRFHNISYIHNAMVAWTQADLLLDELKTAASQIQQSLAAPQRDVVRIREVLSRVADVNATLTKLEGEFSASLGAGSRWLEQLLMTVLVLVVLTIEATGLTLTFLFSRNLNRTLTEVTTTAEEVGRGNFEARAPIHSKDELGQLAFSLNKMIDDLKRNVGQRKQAENANHVKSVFLANMSHEIRTPLGVILGFVDVLKNPQLPQDERIKYLDIIESTGHNLGRIINDILDISKVESGHIELEWTKFNIEEFFSELNVLFRLKAEQRGNQINFEINSNSRKEIFTDRLRLQQVLINLISNALRFTENGRIQVKYSSSGSKLFFRVQDTGIGISEEQTSKLFALFSQADQSITRRYGGTGLGLVLSKKLAKLLGGDVVLENTVLHQGSTFLATIDCQGNVSVLDMVTNSVRHKLIEASSLKGKKVLIVDDSIENQLLLQLYLTKMGMSVQCAPNGEVGVKKALADNYDIILMDIQMPILDGYTATEQLRAHGYTRPIVALTANAMKEDRDRSLKAGCNDYVTKPIESSRLMKTLALNLDQ